MIKNKIVARCKRLHPHIRYIYFSNRTQHHDESSIWQNLRSDTHTHALQFHPELLRCISETSKTDSHHETWRKIFVLQFCFNRVRTCVFFALAGLCVLQLLYICTRTHQQQFFILYLSLNYLTLSIILSLSLSRNFCLFRFRVEASIEQQTSLTHDTKILLNFDNRLANATQPCFWEKKKRPLQRF